MTHLLVNAPQRRRSSEMMSSLTELLRARSEFLMALLHFLMENIMKVLVSLLALLVSTVFFMNIARALPTARPVKREVIRHSHGDEPMTSQKIRTGRRRSRKLQGTQTYPRGEPGARKGFLNLSPPGLFFCRIHFHYTTSAVSKCSIRLLGLLPPQHCHAATRRWSVSPSLLSPL